ncbi:hypothetical protein FA15DRAFT_674453 [Coprinopsis marcescibilis]|uniref:Uncharacterized protein n=1 Tax=Coprinopsis marcescibilis TaxID=230819 RepID=A0A5C3KHU0_COPMA|nr:hypothetical protein FA15DRAFT_674453 [Coprinopsis marcescibilis]
MVSECDVCCFPCMLCAAFFSICGHSTMCRLCAICGCGATKKKEDEEYAGQIEQEMKSQHSHHHQLPEGQSPPQMSAQPAMTMPASVYNHPHYNNRN